jgi:hypothetical protein
LDPSIIWCKMNSWRFENTSTKILRKGSFDTLKFLTSVLILFAKKKNGSLCMCVDYHGLNQLTIKNQYPLSLISGLLNQLSHAKVYTKIDLHGTYIQLGTHSKRWWMENGVQISLWPFWIHCDAFWPYQCTYCLSTSNKWCLS